jgi:hypothetical protein
MPTESTMLYARSRPSKANRGDVDLTTRRLIEVSVNPFDLWAKVTRKIDRALTSIGGYAHDEALAEVLEIRS